ncbi:Transcriptional regulatory protein ZraR [Methylacidimicrobium cyclopophantes]|uniref:Transcriptional regulatory protein ZraR n=1 Tax=Methylacidimicrobium cyclopophantes TaxID=1041766 RepID=A0A5E6M895_9BACT|nr:sigma-54 dependent transcriptional regulator [Methylacidimicrobium cyclopophantes]VVM05583.1 Transcriptional regulatory protein ZraR [Methylacidimicrobium cyclopophantes]
MATILIVDDDLALSEALAETVRSLGHRARIAASGEEALAALGERAVDGVLLDLRMPGMDGLELLGRIQRRADAPPVAVLTAHATAANTIEAMRLGAFDHLTKPIGRADLARLLGEMLQVKSRSLRNRPEVGTPEFVGSSEAMRKIQKIIGMVADSDATVLVEGETGTGKELVARAIHDHGRRRDKPFVAVNCAAIPAELLESELFGHLRGAFTGAHADRRGAFLEADGGTLFLDEIGDMSLSLQPKILRALQERVIAPIGGKPMPVDVRVVAATNRDLLERVREGAFRQDLFYRLHVVPIHLPPLRERISDILPLAEHFLAPSGKWLAADAAARLVRHPWPGNVRELRNVMERMAVLVRGKTITAADLDLVSEESGPSPFDWPDEDLPSAIARLEEMLIRRALVRSGGNRAEAARVLGIHRQLLYAKIRRYGFDSSEGEAG